MKARIKLKEKNQKEINMLFRNKNAIRGTPEYIDLRKKIEALENRLHHPL